MVPEEVSVNVKTKNIFKYHFVPRFPIMSHSVYHSPPFTHPPPHLKTSSLFFDKPPLKSTNCPSPRFRQIPPYLLVFDSTLPPLKTGFFSEPL